MRSSSTESTVLYQDQGLADYDHAIDLLKIAISHGDFNLQGRPRD